MLRDSYGAPLETVDFMRANEAARATINQWVATQTRGRIPENPGPPAISPPGSAWC